MNKIVSCVNCCNCWCVILIKYLQLAVMQTGNHANFHLHTIKFYIINALMKMHKTLITKDGVEQMTIQ